MPVEKNPSESASPVSLPFCYPDILWNWTGYTGNNGMCTAGMWPDADFGCSRYKGQWAGCWGKRGWFYQVAGIQASGIDGPCGLYNTTV